MLYFSGSCVGFLGGGGGGYNGRGGGSSGLTSPRYSGGGGGGGGGGGNAIGPYQIFGHPGSAGYGGALKNYGSGLSSALSGGIGGYTGLKIPEFKQSGFQPPQAADGQELGGGQ